jgi:hypothetical protein
MECAVSSSNSISFVKGIYFFYERQRALRRRRGREKLEIKIEIEK